MKAQWDKGDRRIWWAQAAGRSRCGQSGSSAFRVWISTGLPWTYIHSWPHEYSILPFTKSLETQLLRKLENVCALLLLSNVPICHSPMVLKSYPQNSFSLPIIIVPKLYPHPQSGIDIISPPIVALSRGLSLIPFLKLNYSTYIKVSTVTDQ